ncbi:MAG: cytochrome c maturation protein CcmE [Chthonomonadales bacterium]
MKPAYWIAFLVVGACMFISLYAFSDAMAQHTTISQAVAKPGVMLQVPGKIIKETVQYDSLKGRLQFNISEPNDPTKVMTIVYSEPKPENFDAATSVEAVGEYRDGAFHAKNLLVKCPSKYNDDKPAKTAGTY